jgi:hypothetical protein
LSPSSIPLQQLIPALKRLNRGSVSVKAKTTNIIQINTAPNELIVDLQNIEIIKTLLNFFREFGVLNSVEEEKQEQSILHQLRIMKGLAESLNEANMTVRLQQMGETMLVIGERASPRLSRLILGNSIQADILKITSLMRDLR